MNPDTTPTPRTDAVIQSPNSFYMVRVENLCRELERELAQKTNEVARLKEELAEIKETYASIVNQPHFDEREVHCSCVPALREEVARLRDEIQKLKQTQNRPRLIGPF